MSFISSGGFHLGDRVRITCLPASYPDAQNMFGHVIVVSGNGQMAVKLLNGTYMAMLQPGDLEHVD
jgi:hypothetical protein